MPEVASQTFDLVGREVGATLAEARGALELVEAARRASDPEAAPLLVSQPIRVSFVSPEH